jgi:hypothetical protein
MTGCPFVNHFENYSPVDETVAQNFEDEKGPGPQGSMLFQMYFGSKWQKSRWNTSVIENMLPVIAVKKAEMHMEEDIDNEVIKAMIWDHIKQAQNSWQRRNPRVAEAGDRVETKQEAELRAKTYDIDRSKQVRRNSHKIAVSYSFSILC